MLAQARTHAALPVADLDRARRFYEGTLGLVPLEVTPGGAQYGTAEGTRFLVFPSSGRASGTHTQMGFTVADIEAEVADLKRRGVAFESYEMPQFDAATSIATFPGSRSAWFKDGEGNLLGVVQLGTPA
jgi:catechol 2,3-dioxygenase-like lactoylglutathione lyase family enzyme